MSNLKDAMWKGESGRLQKARREAKDWYDVGDCLQQHSIMLSAYISIAGSKEYKPWIHPIFALWHTVCMLLQWESLDHNQLDVLIQFLLQLRQKSHIKLFGRLLPDLSEREIRLAKEVGAKPHQIALAYMTHAEVLWLVQSSDKPVSKNIELAVDLKKQIINELDQPQGLRQLVRIYRKAGELYLELLWDELNPHRYNLYNSLPDYYLSEALHLAQGRADCADQISKIQAVINRVNPR